MASEDKFSLFGVESPLEVRRRIMGEAAGLGQSLAGNAPGRGVVGLAGSLGGNLDAMFDFSGRQKKAEDVQKAVKDSYDEDLSVYYKNLAKSLKDIDPQLALQAAQAGAQYEIEKRSKESLAAQRAARAAEDYADITIKQQEAKRKLDQTNSLIELRKTQEELNKAKAAAEPKKVAVLEKRAATQEKRVDDQYFLGVAGLEGKDADRALRKEAQDWKQKFDKEFLRLKELDIKNKKLIAEGKESAKTNKALLETQKLLMKKFTESGTDKRPAYIDTWIESQIQKRGDMNDFNPFTGLNKSERAAVAAKVKARMADRMAKDISEGKVDTLANFERALDEEYTAVIQEGDMAEDDPLTKEFNELLNK